MKSWNWIKSFNRKIFDSVFCVSLISSLFLIVLYHPPVFSNTDLKVTAEVNRTRAYMNEQVQLLIRVQGDFETAQRPTMPAFQRFQSFYVQRSSKVINTQEAQGSKNIEFIFNLIPTKPGTSTLGPFVVPVDKVIHKTNSVSVEVVPISKGGPPGAPRLPTPSNPISSPQTQPIASTPNLPTENNLRGSDQDIYLKVWSDKTRAYPGEQITVTYSLFTRLDTRYEGFKEEPTTKGFWVEDLNSGGQVPQRTVYVEGRRFIQADIRKAALFATSPGEYTLKPGSIKASVVTEGQQAPTDFFGNFFQDQFFTTNLITKRENRLLGGNDITLIIIPFPEKNKPEAFKGLVGVFNVTAKTDKQVVKANEPVNVEVTIQGQGNVETIEKPGFELPKTFRIIESDTASKVLKIKDLITGWKKFNYIFIPSEEGNNTIGPFRTLFFNPNTKKYVTQSSEAFRLKVLPGEKDLSEETYLSSPIQEEEDALLTSEAFEIKQSLVTKTHHQKLNTGIRHSQLATLLFLILSGLVSWFQRYRRKVEGDVGKLRFKQAFRTFYKGLHKIKRKGKKEKRLTDCYTLTSQLILDYFGDKFNTSGVSLTQKSLEDRLLDESLNRTDLLELKRILQDCDFARFASQGATVQDFQEMVSRLEKLIKRVEKFLKYRSEEG